MLCDFCARHNQRQLPQPKKRDTILPRSISCLMAKSCRPRNRAAEDRPDTSKRAPSEAIEYCRNRSILSDPPYILSPCWLYAYTRPIASKRFGCGSSTFASIAMPGPSAYATATSARHNNQLLALNSKVWSAQSKRRNFRARSCRLGSLASPKAQLPAGASMRCIVTGATDLEPVSIRYVFKSVLYLAAWRR